MKPTVASLNARLTRLEQEHRAALARIEALESQAAPARGVIPTQAACGHRAKSGRFGCVECFTQDVRKHGYDAAVRMRGLEPGTRPWAKDQAEQPAQAPAPTAPRNTPPVGTSVQRAGRATITVPPVPAAPETPPVSPPPSFRPPRGGRTRVKPGTQPSA